MFMIQFATICILHIPLRHVHLHIAVPSFEEGSMEVGTWLQLSSKTRKGQNKINQFGEQWIICAAEACVQCLNNQPGYFIKALDIRDNAIEASARWILQDGDPNFNLTML